MQNFAPIVTALINSSPLNILFVGGLLFVLVGIVFFVLPRITLRIHSRNVSFGIPPQARKRLTLGGLLLSVLGVVIIGGTLFAAIKSYAPAPHLTPTVTVNVAPIVLPTRTPDPGSVVTRTNSRPFPGWSDTLTHGQAEASCGSGQTMVGGGFKKTEDAPFPLLISASYPSDPTHWAVTYVLDQPSSAPTPVAQRILADVFAICLIIPPSSHLSLSVEPEPSESSTFFATGVLRDLTPATCPSGDFLLSGGYDFDYDLLPDGHTLNGYGWATESYPDTAASPPSWHVRGQLALNAKSGKAYALCGHGSALLRASVVAHTLFTLQYDTAQNTETATCDPGFIATGGGYQEDTSADQEKPSFVSDGPFSDESPLQWSIDISFHYGTVYAVCVPFTT